MGDLDRQAGVERASDGCLGVVVLLILATIALAVLAWGSMVMIGAAAALVLSGVGLVAVEWAVQG